MKTEENINAFSEEEVGEDVYGFGGHVHECSTCGVRFYAQLGQTQYNSDECYSCYNYERNR